MQYTHQSLVQSHIIVIVIAIIIKLPRGIPVSVFPLKRDFKNVFKRRSELVDVNVFSLTI